MVDVLINCLLKNKEMVEELSVDRPLEVGEGEEGWRAFYEHPLTAATSAMLNIGANEDHNAAMGLLCEYYKLPVDKALADKYAVLPEFWTTNNQAGIVGSIAGSPGAALLPQAAGILKTRSLSDPGDLASPEVDIYLNRGLVKREGSTNGQELIVPTTGVITSLKSSDLFKNGTVRIMHTEDDAESSPESPLPIIVVKQEPISGGLSTSPSPPVSKTRELPPASTVIAQAYSNHVLAHNYEALTTTANLQYQSQPATSVYMVATPPDYRNLSDYYTEQFRHSLAAATVATASSPVYNDPADTASFVDRYIRQAAGLKGGIQGLTVDLPSPDSGIGDTTVTPREAAGFPQVGEMFDHSQNLLPSRPASSQSSCSRRSWHNSDTDKVNIHKIHSDVGFRYFLESPISTSQRREDDRITYINKGQFYGITLEYVPDPAKPLKSSTVKSVVMLMFREEKPPDEELKAWQFWHSRQHSLKQRILDADTKNSTGIIGQIDEITHNAISFYWNPLESPAKVNIAVQCLSTDFSNQKGVKGLPLHLQIDTFDDFRENATPYNRGYCQIKVFCDKGAERKTRDEERRAAKRKLTTSGNSNDFAGRKKVEEMYHVSCDRSEFYSMSDLAKPPILFTPCDDVEKITSMDLNFYTNHSVAEEQSNSGIDRRETDSSCSTTFTPPPKRIKLYPCHRVLLYARQESEATFQPLHVVPPTLAGLAKGIENKYKINASSIRNVYKRCKKGMLIHIDDDIIKHYCNEDVCIIEVSNVDEELCDITLVEL